MEKAIIDSGLIRFLLGLHHDTNKNNSNGYLIWSHELAHALSLDQIGVSACGPTAVYNVLSALAGRSIFALNGDNEENMVNGEEDSEEQNNQIPLIDPESLLRILPARLRNYEAPLVEYLISRIKAGTIHQDLIDGITSISNNKVSGFFFQFPARISEKELYEWFIYWLKRDTVPVATENLMILGNDAWHHQMIYGVERIPKSTFKAVKSSNSTNNEDYIYKVHATNPMEPISMNILKETVTSDPFMQIPASHVVERYSRDQRKMKFQMLEDELFNETTVLDQIKGIFSNECPDDAQYANVGPNNSPYIYLPWGGIAGITLFCKTNSLAFDQLTEYQKKHSTNVYLPAYKKSVVVCKYSSMNDPIS